MNEEAYRIEKLEETRCNRTISISSSILGVGIFLCFIIVIKSGTRNNKYEDKSCITEECVTASVFLADTINNKSDPCDNFYNFSCGRFEEQSTLEEAQNRVNESLKSLITSRVNKDDSRSVKLQKKYYTACMDQTGIEEDDNESLKTILNELGGWPLLAKHWNASYNWGQIVDKCIELGLYYDWFLNIHNEPTFNGTFDTLEIKPPDNTVYLSSELRRNYNLLIENVENILSFPENDVDSKEINDLIDFEMDLHQIIVESATHSTESSISELRNRFPAIPWKYLLRNVVVDSKTKIISNVNIYIPKLQILLNKTHIRVQMNYILWKIIQSLWNFLSSDIRKAFEVDRDLKDQKNIRRFEYCYEMTNTVFSYVSEAVYARQYTGERKEVEKMVENIKNVLHDHIKLTKWMNQSHQEYAISKLKNLEVIIGAPDEAYDEEQFDELLGTDKIDILLLNNTLDIVRAVDKSRDEYNLNFLKKKVNYVDARFYQGIGNIQATKYIPEKNTIFLPAAILNGIFYSNERPVSSNYGALGTIIAHELVHAFGILDILRYIGGKEYIVWSNSTIDAFFKATECLLDDCNEFSNNITEINCEGASDENFADYSSINLSYEAFKKVETSSKDQLPGLDFTSAQIFWISYALTMCDNLPVNNTKKSTHMQPFQRIIGSYRNSRYFANDFYCHEGTNMNPAEKCIVL
nr:neprilysin-1-like isoform X1 [Leptinotarsa decemlineata]